jgi:hypothetical protein
LYRSCPREGLAEVLKVMEACFEFRARDSQGTKYNWEEGILAASSLSLHISQERCIV